MGTLCTIITGWYIRLARLMGGMHFLAVFIAMDIIIGIDFCLQEGRIFNGF
jgi:hypothetical protein